MACLRARVLLVVVPAVSLALELRGTNELAADADFSSTAWKERPVTKVLKLLKDMQSQLEKEAAQDEEIYQQVACWCETNDKLKTKAIEVAKQRINDLSASVEEYTAKTEQLATELKKLKEEVSSKTKSIGEATGIRSKESAEFQDDEKDLMQSIGGLNGAVEAMSATHGTGLTQSSMLQVQRVLQKHMTQHQKMFAEKLTSQQHSLVTALVQQPVAAESYAPQSGAIFGILKTMKETFEANLGKSQRTEEEAKSQFRELTAAQQREVKAAKGQIEDKLVAEADAKEQLVACKNDLEDTQEALSADTAFLADLKGKCQSIDSQWELRQKMRTEELQALSETVTILSGDEAHDTFSRSLGFLEVRAEGAAQAQVRRQVAAVLRRVAPRSASLKLLQLAVAVRSDPFAKVVANIEQMVQALTTEQAEEVKQRDHCIEEANQNADQTTAATNQKEDIEQKLEDLKSVIGTNGEAVAELQQEIAEAHVQMKQAGGNREAENHAFQMVVTDQRATQAILKKAVARLKQFYASKGAVLLEASARQEPGAAVDPMPAGFGEYKKAGGAGGAIGLLETVIRESEAEEHSAILAEQDAQADYESFMKSSNDAIDAAQESITDKGEVVAKASGEKTLAEGDLAAVSQSLESLTSYKFQLRAECGYIMDNFETRQSERSDEIDALNDSKALFAGAKFDF